MSKPENGAAVVVNHIESSPEAVKVKGNKLHVVGADGKITLTARMCDVKANARRNGLVDVVERIPRLGRYVSSAGGMPGLAAP